MWTEHKRLAPPANGGLKSQTRLQISNVHTLFGRSRDQRVSIPVAIYKFKLKSLGRNVTVLALEELTVLGVLRNPNRSRARVTVDFDPTVVVDLLFSLEPSNNVDQVLTCITLSDLDPF